mgnify:CR=1 FL=1
MRDDSTNWLNFSDMEQRLLEHRNILYKDLGPLALKPPLGDNPLEQFESDTALREAAAQVLHTVILWIEAGRSPGDILEDCPLEIKKVLVCTVNYLLDFLQLRQQRQTGVNLSRGSWVTAWTHLFAEFEKSLLRESDMWMWNEQHDDPYVSA